MAQSIKSYNKRLESLKSERSSFLPLYMELSDNLLAYRGRFLTDDVNDGKKRNTKQLNNKPRMSVRTLASGMMSGITSPARPWFQLGSGDPEMNEHAAVKHWLHEVQTTMYRVFSQSNLYNSLHTLYSEVGVFGTGVMGVYSDYENVIHCVTYTVGSYSLGTNGKNRVDSFYREYELTVGQLEKEFGIDNCSRTVKDMWDNGNTETWVKLVHIVEPNDDRDQMSPLSNNKPWRSVYYETSRSTRDEQDTFLRESGFDEFPLMAPRWNTTGEDIYGTDCPGMDALGDAKALQLGEKRKFTALDILVKPPLQGPSTMRDQVSNGGLAPGEVLWTDQQGIGLTSVYDFRPDLNAMMAINTESEERVSRAFYEDLFLMLANSDRRQITAREVAEKQEEKLLMLGPVLERLHTELLDPLIDRTFNMLQEAGVLPPPPPELQDRELRVEYISVLAQAQRMVAVSGLERTIGFAANLAELWPEARHKIDPMQAIDEFSNAMGVNPRVVRPDDLANQSVQAEQQAAAQQQAAEQGQAMANTAKTVSETDIGGDNALNAALQNAGMI
tara:strand:+ start:2446 stop:4119 length:1674 start_codon:yes stop_codon:yes gene_type:complete